MTGHALFSRKRGDFVANKTSDEKQTLRCSFCNKTQDQVRKLIAGPNVFICDECIDICA